MKLTTKQANQLQRLFTACENAKNFDESCARDERLNVYMEKLMRQGIEAKEITDLLYA